MSCVVWGCKSHSSRKENSQELLTFHRFPVDDAKKKEWIIRINRPNWIPTNHSRICSKHFTLDSFVCATNSKWRRLREDAIPTVNIMDQTDAMDPVTKEPFEKQSQQYLRTILHQTQESVPMDYFEAGPSTSRQTTFHQSQDCVLMNFETVPSTSSQIGAPERSHQISNQNQELLMQVLKTEEYKKKIQTLEKQLERSKKVSKRRLRKINSLTKRVSRLGKKNEDLYSILMEQLKKENIETEYITMLDKINENDVIKRFLEKQDGATSREYSMEVKKFAVTLYKNIL